MWHAIKEGFGWMTGAFLFLVIGAIILFIVAKIYWILKVEKED